MTWNCLKILRISKHRCKLLNTIKRNYVTRNILKLSDRGLWSDRFPSSSLTFEKQLVESPQTVYSGIDPTGNSLHIGHLLVLNALLNFQRAGHHVIILIGGATGRIGDPSGKNKERPLLDHKTLDANCQALSLQVKTIFENHEHFIWNKIKSDKVLQPIRIVNNLEWFKDVSLIEFLRDAGKFMNVPQLLKRTSIKSRLEQHKQLSFTEFAYQILQAWDWYHLYKNYNCSIQVGGNDQLGNIISGHDLISRKEDVEVTGLTVPLMKSETGDKLGKTSGTPIWLSPSLTSPFDFYQSVLRIKDAEIEEYLKLLTFMSLAEIDTLMNLHIRSPDKRLPHKRLAEELTLLVHGEDGLLKAKQGTEILYGNNSSLLAEISSEDVRNIFQNSSYSTQLLEVGTSVLDAAMKAKCFESDAKGIQIIESGGFYINEGRVTNPSLILIPGVHILPNNLSVLRVGKKNYSIIDWGSSAVY